MKRRRILLLLTLAAVAITAGFVLFSPRKPNDPVYEGKRLSQWFAETNGSTSPAEVTYEARMAVSSLGTNAIPYLLHEFERREWTWLAALKQTSFARRMLNRRPQPISQRLRKAASALSSLGPKLAPVLPRLALHLDDPERGPRALFLMQSTGEAGSVYLARGLYSKDPNVICLSFALLHHHPEAEKSAVPRIIELAKHRDQKVRYSSLVALQRFPFAAASTVPALRGALADPSQEIRHVALLALGALGAEAKSAIPDLLSLLKDGNYASLASNAIVSINPAALPPRGP